MKTDWMIDAQSTHGEGSAKETGSTGVSPDSIEQYHKVIKSFILFYWWYWGLNSGPHAC
jgi:hypothetical protein